MALWLNILFFMCLVLAFFWDIWKQIIPDRINAAIFLLGCIYLLTNDSDIFWYHFGASIMIFLLLTIFELVFEHLRGKIGLGFGDIKLFSACAIWLGFEGILYVIFYSCIGAIFIFILRGLVTDIKMSRPMPFAIAIVPCVWFFWAHCPSGCGMRIADIIVAN